MPLHQWKLLSVLCVYRRQFFKLLIAVPLPHMVSTCLGNLIIFTPPILLVQVPEEKKRQVDFRKGVIRLQSAAQGRHWDTPLPSHSCSWSSQKFPSLSTLCPCSQPTTGNISSTFLRSCLKPPSLGRFVAAELMFLLQFPFLILVLLMFHLLHCTFTCGNVPTWERLWPKKSQQE